MNKKSLSDYSFDEVQDLIKQIQFKAQQLNLSNIIMRTNFTFGVKHTTQEIVQNFSVTFHGELFQEQKSNWEEFDNYINSFNLESNEQGQLKNMIELRPNTKQLEQLESEHLQRYPTMENASPLDLSGPENAVVLVIWEYTWVGFDGDKECNPNCEKFMKMIHSKYETDNWKGKVRLIGLNADQFSRNLVKEEINKGKWPIFEHYDLGPGIHYNSILKNWGIINYPALIVLDKERKVVYKGHDEQFNNLLDVINKTMEGISIPESVKEDDLEGSPAENYLNQRKVLQEFIDKNKDLTKTLESYELKFFIINESNNFAFKLNPTYRGKFVFFAKAKESHKDELLKFKEICMSQLGDYNAWMEFNLIRGDGSEVRV